jgi:hypothetical protein
MAQKRTNTKAADTANKVDAFSFGVSIEKKSVKYELDTAYPVGDSDKDTPQLQGVHLTAKLLHNGKMTVKPHDGEHGGKSFYFVNSDPQMVSAIATLLISAVQVQKEEQF